MKKPSYRVLLGFMSVASVCKKNGCCDRMKLRGPTFSIVLFAGNDWA
jgi:hypothetical protein